MDDIQAFILDHDGQQAAVMQFLHDIMMGFPDMVSKIRYRVPFYYRKSWMCYIKPVKDKQVEFVFIRGNELSNEQGLLDAKGRKQVMGVTFDRVEDIPVETLQQVIQEALLLDEMVSYGSKR